jgi:hypothetical protein
MYQLVKPSLKAIDLGFTEPRTVLRLSDNTFIPMHEDNTDYQEYLKWVAEGNQPQPANE